MSNILVRATNNLLDGLIKANGRELNELALKRLRVLGVGLMTMFIYSGIIATNHLLSGEYVKDMWLSLALVIIAVALILTIRVKNAYVLTSNLILLSVVVFTNFHLFSTTAIRVIFFLPILVMGAYLLLGRKWGIVWTICILSIISIDVAIGALGIAQLGTQTSFLEFSLIATVMTSAMFYFYESIHSGQQEIISTQHTQLLLTNSQLKDQLSKSADLTKELSDNFSELKKQNEQLNKTKLAMLNVLDDAKELELQLKSAKTNIEKKVELRTRQLREEQARLQASINTIQIGFLMTLDDGKAVIWNPALLNIFGIPLDSSKAKNMEGLLKKLSLALGETFDLKNKVAECIKTGQRFTATNIEYENKFLRIVGEAIKTADSSSPIGSVIIFEDITEAIRLDRSKDEFMSITSHELRTPLTAIQGNASMIKQIYSKQIKDSDMRQMIDDIQDSSTRLISIVNEFLDMSSLEQGKSNFDLQPVNIVDMVGKVSAGLKGLADKKNLTLVTQLNNSIPLVSADIGRLEEIVTNLVDNAIKYTDKGQVLVTAKHDNKYVTLFVQDTGKGIAPENAHLLFHKFQQANTQLLTRDVSRSTGLGLYICRLLAEQMGGSIKLESSQPAKGSTFSLTLNIADKKYAILRSKHNTKIKR